MWVWCQDSPLKVLGQFSQRQLAANQRFEVAAATTAESSQLGRTGAAWLSRSKDRALVFVAGSGTTLDDLEKRQGLGSPFSLQVFDSSQDLYAAQFGDGSVGVVGFLAQLRFVGVFLGKLSGSQIMRRRDGRKEKL
ncbi:hypothetical protein NDU88_001620 [Pleurodeles waltl]|uniref:Uncharacterized protein n=1 Tax=Pleurodeles waltl TaxID=8319 RepID=A0AAV7WMZ7_PLEWA|nr:hypothetical protein NDU88_001620 [Pleurodeles waltl]